MQLGIDWVSLLLFMGAFALSQVSSVPLRVRYGVLAAAFGGISLIRLRGDREGLNFVFGLIAAAMAAYYLVRAFRSR